MSNFDNVGFEKAAQSEVVWSWSLAAVHLYSYSQVDTAATRLRSTRQNELALSDNFKPNDKPMNSNQ